MASPVDATALQALPGVPCIDKCIPPGMQLAVAISLLAQWGGLSTDPAVLEANTRCFQCIPGNMRMSVIVSLAVQLLAGTAPSMPVVPACSDADATSFLAAAAITDTPTVNAVCTLTQSLKSAGLWTLMDAIYPFVGGTSASNSFNLKNPAAYRITWGGSVAFSSSGITGDGVSGYGDTGFNPATAGGNYSLNSASLGVNIKTSNVENSYVIGIIYTSAAALQFTGATETLVGLNSIAFSSGTPAATTGFLAGSVTNSITETLYLTDGTTVSFAPEPTTIPSFNIGILARNFAGTFNSFSAKTLSFAFIGGGLTGTQVTALQTAVTTFNTALGR